MVASNVNNLIGVSIMILLYIELCAFIDTMTMILSFYIVRTRLQIVVIKKNTIKSNSTDLTIIINNLTYVSSEK